jgi:uncharacterized damage-inducible protein DinB
MRVSEITLLFDHLFWVRNRILAAAAQVPDAFTNPAPVTIRDLRATLVHELDVEWSWRERLRGIPFEVWGPKGELKPADYPTVEAVTNHWTSDEAETRRWLGSLTDRQLNAVWHIEEEPGQILWHHLMHLYTHGLQQFSDAATLLSVAGQSPGELDFLAYVEENPHVET